MIHPTAEVSPRARIGPRTRVWNYTQVRDEASVGDECIIGRNVYVDEGVVIGNRVKVQNNALLYRGVSLEDGVFVGPAATFTNDRHPRAINADGSLQGPDDWVITPTTVRYGASVGAGAVIVCGVEIGRFALVGAGAVVTRDVPDHGLVVGNPAALVGFVCVCARRLRPAERPERRPVLRCATCHLDYDAARPRFETARPTAADASAPD
jgi:acetyltransferase-like isoleucine patch superfamily enzyme